MKDRTVMRSDMRSDLKDSGALWSDTELNRCIERATSDLSRYLPRERVIEEQLEFTITDETVTFPADTSATYIVNAQTFNAKVAGSAFTVAAQPDYPRVLTLLVTDADNSVTDWHIRVYGTDEEDAGVTEDFYFGNGKGQTGRQIFKRVHKVELVEDFGGTGAAGDTLSIGIGAYTDVWVQLAHKPVKWGSESSSSLSRNTDYLIDYARGMIKAISGGDIAAESEKTFSYKKSQLIIDLSPVDDFIRVYRVEYPVGEVPQTFCQYELYGTSLIITGMGSQEPQSLMSEHSHVRIYYEAIHHSPTDYTPGTVPEFLENTVLLVAEAYALFIYALKAEHQAVTDITAARTAISSANSAQTGVATALTNMVKYLNNNGASDMAGVLALCQALHTAIITSLDAAKAYLDSVATDLTNADAVRAEYLTTNNYVDGGTEPDVKTYLESGDALINHVTEGGENEKTPEVYAEYARVVREALIGTFEQDRQLYQQNATARTNAALALIQEASQRIQNIASNLEQASRYNDLASSFAREAEDRMSQIASYLQEATGYIDAVSNDLTMSDRFRTEAQDRRDEAYGIWRDRKSYIGGLTSSAVLQAR